MKFTILPGQEKELQFWAMNFKSLQWGSNLPLFTKLGIIETNTVSFCKWEISLFLSVAWKSRLSFFSSCCVSKHFHFKMYSSSLKKRVTTGKGSDGTEDDAKHIHLFNHGSTVCDMCIGSVMRSWVFPITQSRLQIVHWRSRLFRLHFFYQHSER